MPIFIILSKSQLKSIEKSVITGISARFEASQNY